MKQINKVILIIRDGWGYNSNRYGNAQALANIPSTNYYESRFPFTLLKAHGNAVGLPEGVQGGSEVGHYTIGAGRIIWQEFERINRAIKDKTFFKNKVLMNAVKHIKKYNSNLHLMGLFSDEGVHGTIEHLYALLKSAKQQKIKNVYVHCFLDGRDVPEKSAGKYFKEFKKRVGKLGINAKIASIIGRYYAMDRDNNWGRTKKAYELLVKGKGKVENDPILALKNAYRRGDPTDYYIRPIKLKGTENVKENDAVIFWNFRTDRARQLTYTFVDKGFKKFKIKKLKNLMFIGMTRYDKNLRQLSLFPEVYVKNNLGSILAKNNLRQLRIAETEKYAHTTFFFNSQIETPNKGEDRIMVPSPKCPSYAQKPEMSAYKITEELLKQIKRDYYQFILVNFANGDLVGHSGNLKATIKCCEVVDSCVGDIIKTGLKYNYTILLTSDHGNCEEMLYHDGKPKPSHTLNPVQFTIISKDKKLIHTKLKNAKGLASIAPTILEIMKIKKPKEMAESLFY